jgi:trk system potassium uptake protein TrkA
MRVVIVGGGKVGGYLAAELLDAGHGVTVIEGDTSTAQRLAERVRGVVINGDGTDIETLRSASVERADWLLGVTGQDEINLVACELAATLGVKSTLARLNDPRNEATFAALGIRVVGVTGLIGEVIERELDREFLDRVTLLGLGSISIIEVEVSEGMPPRKVRDFELPPETMIITVSSPEGPTTVPSGDTVVRSGDRVVAITGIDREPQVRNILCGESS